MKRILKRFRNPGFTEDPRSNSRDKFGMTDKTKLFLILLLALVLRLYGLNWDGGTHLHPDERMLIMVAEKIHFFKNLNPDFFNYGSLPIYLLKASAQLLDLIHSHFSRLVQTFPLRDRLCLDATGQPLVKIATYDGMLYLGRVLSAGFDIFTLILVYKIAFLIFNKAYISCHPDPDPDLPAGGEGEGEGSSDRRERKKTKFTLRQIRIAFARFFSFDSFDFTQDKSAQGQNDEGGTKRTALFAAFFYAIAFFPIQNSHFFIVDTFMTFFITLLIYLLLRYLKQPSNKRVLLIALASAGAVACKFTAIIFLPVIFAVLFFSAKGFKQKAQHLLSFIFYLLSFIFLSMPYAFLEHQRFIKDITAQIKMNSDAFVFPYTLQYVGTTPYLYYLKNIFFWGLGPIISILALIGLTEFILLFFDRLKILNRVQNDSFTRHSKLFFFIFYLFFFILIGRSAVKFMRYLLPLYPFFAIMAGYALGLFSHSASRKDLLQAGLERSSPSPACKFLQFLAGRNDIFLKALPYAILIAATLWSLMFVNIYSYQHPRLTASDWMRKNIPAGSTLAVEHWDDRMPIRRGEKFEYQELGLYERPDDEKKWQLLNNQLDQTDYIIISSNRLYVPLQRLTDCKKYPKACYPNTAEYYKKLFAGQLGFSKIAEFTVSPSLKIGQWGIEINDQSADESFTVYDHPKVMVFKKDNP